LPFNVGLSTYPFHELNLRENKKKNPRIHLPKPKNLDALLIVLFQELEYAFKILHEVRNSIGRMNCQLANEYGLRLHYFDRV